MSEHEFKVGDQVVISHPWQSEQITRIEEITKAGNYKTTAGSIFNKRGKMRGSNSSYGSTYIYPATKERVDKINNRRRMSYIKEWRFEQMNFEEIDKVYALLQNIEKERAEKSCVK